jgi:hypothetical protein
VHEKEETEGNWSNAEEGRDVVKNAGRKGRGLPFLSRPLSLSPHPPSPSLSLPPSLSLSPYVYIYLYNVRNGGEWREERTKFVYVHACENE